MCKNCCRINGTSPFWMGQNFTESCIVCFVVQQTLHPIDFRIDFVAIKWDHRQSRTWINIVCPITFRSNLFAHIFSKVEKLDFGSPKLEFHDVNNGIFVSTRRTNSPEMPSKRNSPHWEDDPSLPLRDPRLQPNLPSLVGSSVSLKASTGCNSQRPTLRRLPS